MDRLFFALGALSACMAVIAGALGSHALKHRLAPDMLAVFEIGVRYQMYHALALLGVGLASARWGGAYMAVGGWCFIIGTFLFSGSIYQLSLTNTKFLGIVTPIGGAIWMIGWVSIALGALRAK
ncbi:protein of unknown function DUF423 [Solidesulfovibrio fructosivorans JJ]]|uniref:DUF423 domain-containing protein n=1 Tax=Solidesulfovibrio fructosivorans JJ] TaxID=596151 RepID=E1JXE4_SOLFR|nr:DUF423 domain-containing protein [Solidesulfovibrio fructosivorans]EFL50921.1 protein of unknown function DUF423 [Solidesulfovibrio fructosivorans JJ]]